MVYQKSLVKISRYVLIIIIFAGISISCTNVTNTDSTQARLKEYVDTIKVINTHEHQRWFPQYDGNDINFYTILNHSYLQADLVSAGAKRVGTKSINDGNLDTLWEDYGRYLDFSRSTSYYSHFLEGFRILYGYNNSYFTKEGIRSLSEKITANYKIRTIGMQKHLTWRDSRSCLSTSIGPRSMQSWILSILHWCLTSIIWFLPQLAEP